MQCSQTNEWLLFPLLLISWKSKFPPQTTVIFKELLYSPSDSCILDLALRWRSTCAYLLQLVQQEEWMLWRTHSSWVPQPQDELCRLRTLAHSLGILDDNPGYMGGDWPVHLVPSCWCTQRSASPRHSCRHKQRGLLLCLASRRRWRRHSRESGSWSCLSRMKPFVRDLQTARKYSFAVVLERT